MSDLLLWLWEHLDKVSILLGGLVSLGGYYFYHWTTELADPASLEKLRPYLDDSRWRATYRRTLDRALDTADRFFGPPISWRAIGVCLTIAAFYPLLLFLLTWSLSGLNASGLAAVFPTDQLLADRIIILAILILAVSAIFMDINYEGGFMRVGSTLARLTPSWIWKREISWTGLVLFVGATTYLNTVSIAATLSAAVVTAITLGLDLTRFDGRSFTFEPTVIDYAQNTSAVPRQIQKPHR